MNDSYNLRPAHHHPVPRHILDRCPVQLGTYATLHLDTVGKILNHVLLFNLVCDVLLFFSSFSVSLLEHNLGFDTVLCSFLLSAVTVVILLIVNNSRISALSILQPTEYMVGVATGLAIGAAVLAAVLSSTYKTVSHCVVADDKDTSAAAASSATDTNTTAISTTTAAHGSNDPNYDYMCKNMKTTFSYIWFWAGLSAWLNAISALLLMIGRQQLSTAHHQQHYETIGGSQQTPDFEETFRRQQQEILGSQRHAEIQQRAASMFVGDYATIPEVTQGSVPPSGNNRGNSESAAILTV